MMIAPAAESAGRALDVKARVAGRTPASEIRATLTQQYRDRHALTYELDCSGKRLALRFVFPTEDALVWQLEARIDAEAVVTGSAPTREQAFQAMIDRWESVARSPGSPQLDWQHVAVALRAVKALGEVTR
jgi:hypothetical protein